MVKLGKLLPDSPYASRLAPRKTVKLSLTLPNMADETLFLEAARRHGFSDGSAQAAFAAVLGRLHEHGVAAHRFYIFRTGDGGGGGSDGSPSEGSGRPRVLLAFQSPDTALGFAQRGRLGVSPRLIDLSLGQALAAMLQRPAIETLLIADEADEPPPIGALPPGLRIDRATLIELLTGVTP